MFTGLVEAVGTVVRSTPSPAGVELELESTLDDVRLGDSVSVAGVCLTATRVVGTRFTADVSAETLRCTTLGQLTAPTKVNLERAVLASTRLGGHMVTGHVDAVTQVLRVTPSGAATQYWFELPSELKRFVAQKGSVAIDGVSLTVNEVLDTSFSVMLIPHTLQATTLSSLVRGAGVNCEVDTVARYVARQFDAMTSASDSRLMTKLQRGGFA